MTMIDFNTIVTKKFTLESGYYKMTRFCPNKAYESNDFYKNNTTKIVAFFSNTIEIEF